MVLRRLPAAHITDSYPLQESFAMTNTTSDSACPPPYSTPGAAIEQLPSYDDPSHNVNLNAPPLASRATKQAPPEATATEPDLEANTTATTIRAPPNSLNTTYGNGIRLSLRPTRRARACAGIGIAVIVLTVILFFAGMFWPRHSQDDGEQGNVFNDEDIVTGDQGVVFRRS